MERSVVIATMRSTFMNENPAITLLTRRRKSPPATISGSLVLLKTRILVYTAVDKMKTRSKTVTSDVGGIKYIMERAKPHKMTGRNRYCNFICHLL